MTITFDEQVPVTMVVSQTIKAGCTERFERWLHVVAADALKFPGHLGVNVIRPTAGSRQYSVSFRFRTPAELESWLDSDTRARHLAQLSSLSDESSRCERLSGMEAWFSLPGEPMTQPPPRHKMAVISFIAVFSLLVLITRLAAPLLMPLPELARMAVVSATLIGIMTYGLMPLLTRLLHGWLQRSKSPAPRADERRKSAAARP